MQKGPYLCINVRLAKSLGLNEAIVLSQVGYWLKRSGHTFRGRNWVHNTYPKWQAQFPFWSLPTIRRIFNSLEAKGFLESASRTSSHGKYYTLNDEQLKKVGFADQGNRLYSSNIKMTLSLDQNNSEQNDCDQNDQDAQIDQGDQNDSKVRAQNDHLQETCSFQGGAHNDQAAQFDQGHMINLITSYITNTENTRQEDPPPLTPPPSITLPASRQEEEEKSKKDKKIKVETQQGAPQETPKGAALFQQMVEIWNARVQSQLSPGSDVLLTPQRSTCMATFLQEMSVSDLTSWEAYCDKIALSRFLMGENNTGFRVTLDWALNPLKARKIFENAIFDKPSSNGHTTQKAEKPWTEFVSSLKQHCTEKGYSDRWFEACKVLVTLLGQATFENWFKEVAPEEKGHTLQLTAKNAFLCDYIRTYWEDALQKAVRAAYPLKTHIQIQAHGDPPASVTALPDFGVNRRQCARRSLVLLMGEIPILERDKPTHQGSSLGPMEVTT